MPGDRRLLSAKSGQASATSPLVTSWIAVLKRAFARSSSAPVSARPSGHARIVSVAALAESARPIQSICRRPLGGKLGPAAPERVLPNDIGAPREDDPDLCRNRLFAARS